jgi:hypothetical protein
MEVHHHSHLASSETHIPTSRGKKWKHYFWEFLMLFLAVFCGFLAENQREHIIEHQREKKFARRLVSDLQQDTAFLNKRIARLEDRKIKYAEFLSVMTNPSQSSSFNVMKVFGELLKTYKSQFTTTTYNQ